MCLRHSEATSEAMSADGLSEMAVSASQGTQVVLWGSETAAP